MPLVGQECPSYATVKANGPQPNPPQVVRRIFPADAEDIKRLRYDFGVTAVLNVQTDEDLANWGVDWPQLEAGYRRSGIEVRRVPVQDFERSDLRAKLPECVAALDELLQTGNTVYVHCNMGVNRSPTIAIAYLHWVLGWELNQAVQYVITRRECDPYVETIREARWK